MKRIEVTDEQIKLAKEDYVNNLVPLKTLSKKYNIPYNRLRGYLKDVVRSLGEANLAARKLNPYNYVLSKESRDKISKTLKEHNLTNKRLGLKKPYQKENNVEKNFRLLVETTNFEWEQYYFIDELDKNYEVDFAIPKNKLLFEINGPHHYDEDGNFTEYHIRRKKEIESCGYKIVDIYYKDTYYEDKLKSILKENCESITFENPRRRILTYKEKEVQRIIKLIKESDIDFTKLGWVTEVAKVIGIWPQHVNKWMKKNMLEFYVDVCFKRKS